MPGNGANTWLKRLSMPCLQGRLMTRRKLAVYECGAGRALGDAARSGTGGGDFEGGDGFAGGVEEAEAALPVVFAVDDF